MAVASNGYLELKLRNVYVADDWLFITSYIIKADDELFEFPVGMTDIERDNGAGGIWEWTHGTAGPQELRMLRAVASAKQAVIRYQGKQYRKDRTIPASEKAMLRDVLVAYEMLQAK